MRRMGDAGAAQGANHYYAGQPDKQEAACRIVIDWMNRKGLLFPPMPLHAAQLELLQSNLAIAT